MCGITGIVNFNNYDITYNIIKKMTQTISHRGPDFLDLHLDHQFAFGHTRLSIIDLSSSANQPMQDSDSKVFITYNGEIYNFQEIKKELEDLGHTFKSTSDTEVIIYAYKEWGIDCIKKFNGMFVFGLFDKIKNIFYLARDRFGIKPVYYFYTGQTFAFCSEIKGLLEFPLYQKKINLKGVSDFLSFRQTIPPETLFEEIFILKPSTYLELTKEDLSFYKYWDISPYKKKSVSKKDKEQIKNLIRDSIKRTLIADVPIISYLSGGIDSSIIVSEASKLSNIPTITADFKDKGFSEKEYASLVASKLKVDNITLEISRSDYLENILELIRYKDQPLGMHNEVALYLLAKRARREAKVALSGEGSDELFGGYGRIFRFPFEFYKKKFFFFWRKKVNFFNSFIKVYSYFPQSEKLDILNEKTKEIIKEDSMSLSQLNNIFEETPTKSFYFKIFHFFQKFHLHGLLTMMDSTAMAVGLEVRFPFVDHLLVEKVISLPVNSKLKWKSPVSFFRSLFKQPIEYSEIEDITKSLLKELYLNILPEKITERKKMVFPVPLKEWFGEDFLEETKNILFEKDARCSEIFNLEKLRNWIDHHEHDSLFGRRIWLILNLELWLREYFPNKSVQKEKETLCQLSKRSMKYEYSHTNKER